MRQTYIREGPEGWWHRPLQEKHQKRVSGPNKMFRQRFGGPGETIFKGGFGRFPVACLTPERHCMQPGRKRKSFLRGGPPERKEIAMTRMLARLALLVLALTVSISAFAASKSQTVVLAHDTQLNGATIPAGQYKVKVDISGSTCVAKVMDGAKLVTTANCEVKQLDKKASDNMIIENNAGGVPSISEMDFHDSTTAITFSSGATTTASGQ
jgi:hypothetical protein